MAFSFGAPASTPAPTSLFGGFQNAQPATTTAAPTTTPSLFGSTGTPAAGTGTGGGLFGASSNTTGNAGTGMFGNANAAGSLFGQQQQQQQQQQPQQQPQQQQQQPSNATGSLFGNTNTNTSLFPQPTQQPTTLFTQQPSLLGNNSVFGNAPQQQQRVTRSKKTLQERLQVVAQGVIPSQEGYKLRVRLPPPPPFSIPSPSSSSSY